MSTEEIIHAWKNEQRPGSAEESESEPGGVPTNPAGGQELSDEELELVEGGLVPNSIACSCNDGSCHPTL